MCSEPSLSPVKWRRRSWRSIISAHKETAVPSSIPVAVRVHELEKRQREKSDDNLNCLKEMLQRLIDLHSIPQYAKGDTANTTEELQAIMFELQEVRLSLLSFERKYAAVQKKSEKLEADLNMTKRQLDMAREEALSRCKNTYQSTKMKSNQSIDDCILDCNGNINENENLSILKELNDKVVMLNKELEERDAIIENERRLHKLQLKDFILAVKAAERHREEAEAEVQRLIEVNRMVVSADEALWADLMQKYQSSSKRNALLTWAQTHLTAYPSITVSNFTSDWNDGRAFCALIHHFQPDMVDRIMLMERDLCSQLALQLAAKLNININLETFSNTIPDFKLVMAAVFELYKKFDAGGEQQC
ncbi:hypothetical protein DICVIV_02980 [Dictyocaulus viviparus]|uniref:Calponin-homology (CH) domain-containing protein n=1 Tax=Dictyocaulus viviparus TaxID=29172 RepID=A0A0D8Y2A4_DICVI|nr:hypothetical protein DICVIV_02980 [Dictyocaulus viviparus]